MVTGPSGTHRCLRVQSPLAQPTGSTGPAVHLSALCFTLKLSTFNSQLCTLNAALFTLKLYAFRIGQIQFR